MAVLWCIGLIDGRVMTSVYGKINTENDHHVVAVYWVGVANPNEVNSLLCTHMSGFAGEG